MTIDQLFKTALSSVLVKGTASAPRGKKVLELSIPTVFTLDDPASAMIASKIRRVNYRFGASEAMWMMSGRNDLYVSRFNGRMKEFSDDGKTLWGAYGPRLVQQLDHVISSIKRDPDTRQAVVTTWRPMVFNPDCEDGPEWDGASWRSKDVPCTVAWHFMVRDGRLNLTVFMRSNDVWLGLPYDVFSFTTVQRIIASMVGVEVGVYHHVVSNLHVYDQNATAALAVVDEPSMAACPTMPGFGDLTWSNLSGVRSACSAIMDSYHDDLTSNPGFTTNPGFRAFMAIIDYDLTKWDQVVYIPIR